MNFKKLTAGVLVAGLLAVPFTSVLADDRESESKVEFVGGELYIPDNPLLVPQLDFGIHTIRAGSYNLPALPSRSGVFETLPPNMTFADDILPLTGVAVADATDRAHFIEIRDFRGASAAGWRMNVQRTEFFTAEAWTDAYTAYNDGYASSPVPVITHRGPNHTAFDPTTDVEHWLSGVELRFGEFSAFAVGGGIPPTNFPTGSGSLVVSNTAPTTFVSADAGQGTGVHRVQIGERTTEALSATANANRGVHDAGHARNEDIRLLIPGGATVQATEYRARLTWSFVNAPGTVGANTALPSWALPPAP